jgi:uncharacterized protein
LSIYFVDTSSLVKRYLAEDGSKWVQSWIDPKFGHTVILSELCLIELVSAFAKKKREGEIQISQLRYLRGRFLRHVKTQEYLLIPINFQVQAIARELVVKYDNPYLRSLDAIQLASAIQAKRMIKQSIIFITSDIRLNQIAPLEGFTVDDPSLHP